MVGRSKFLNSKVLIEEETAGLTDIPLGFGASVEAVEKSTDASLESGQLELSRKILNDYIAEVESATGVRIKNKQGISETFRGVEKGTEGGFLFGQKYKDSAAEYDKQIAELAEKFPGKFTPKSTAKLREDFLAQRLEQAAGTDREKSVAGAVAGFAKSIITDFPTMLGALISGGAGSVAGSVGSKIALEGTVSALTEAAIQSQIEGSKEEKALAILGAGVGPAALRALGMTAKGASKIGAKAINKLTAKSGNNAARFAAEAEKAATKLSPEAQAVVKSEADILKAYGGRLDEAVAIQTKQKAQFEANLPIQDAQTSVKFNPKVAFKSAVKEFDEAGVAAKASDDLGRFTKRRADAGLSPREVLKELLTSRPDVNVDIALRDFDALVKGGQDLDTIIQSRIASISAPPLTSSGKFATNLEKVAVIGKKGSPLKGKSALKASIYDTIEEARENLARLKKDKDALANLQVFKNKEGKYAIVGNTEIKTLPKGGSYKTLEEAQAALPKFADKFGIDVAEISPVKTRFLSDKTGEVGETYKLALHATERDLKAFDLDLPGSMEESYMRMQKGFSEASVETPKTITSDEYSTLSRIVPETPNLEARMDRLAVAEGSKDLGYKKLNGDVKRLREVAKAIKACTI